MRILKFIIIGLLLLVLPVCALQWGYYAKFKAGIIAREVSAMELVADMQKERLEAFVASNLDRLDLVASRRIFRELLSDYLARRDKEVQYQLNRSLLDTRRAVPAFAVLSVADLSGRIITSTDNALIGTEVRTEDTFILGSEENTIMLAIPSEGEYDEAHVLLSGPMVLDGKVAGVALLQVDPAELLALLRGPQAVTEDYWTLAQRVDAVRVALITPAPNGTTLTQRIVPEDGEPHLSAALRGADVTVFEPEPLPVIQVTRFIPAVGWVLTMAKDASSVGSAMADFRHSMLLLALLLSAFVVGGSLCMARLPQRHGSSRHHFRT